MSEILKLSKIMWQNSISPSQVTEIKAILETSMPHDTEYHTVNESMAQRDPFSSVPPTKISQ